MASLFSYSPLPAVGTTKWADDESDLEDSRLVCNYLSKGPSFTVHMDTKYVTEPARLPLDAGAYLPPGRFEPMPVPAAEQPPAEPAKPCGDWETPSVKRDQRRQDQQARAAFKAREARRLANERRARRNGVSQAALAATRRANGATPKANVWSEA